MNKRGGLIFGLLAALLALVLTGCPDVTDSPPSPPPPPGSHLNPLTVKIEQVEGVPRNLSTEWGTIVAEVIAAEKYVILDLTDCIANSNAISGAEHPSGNDMNIIRNYSYIMGIILPSSLVTIGEYAFYGCSSLTSVTIPASVSTIGDSVFDGSRGSYTVHGDNANYSSQDGVLFNKNKTTLIRYNGRKSGAYTIPASVETIGENAFYNCEGLTSVTIPEGVQTIEQYAFMFCTSLTSATISRTVTTIAWSAFSGCPDLTSVTFASGSSIIQANFNEYAFNGDLQSKYLSGGAGTYRVTGTSGGNKVWTKQVG
jgi:hypothetical protein